MNRTRQNTPNRLCEWGFDYETILRNLFSESDFDPMSSSPKVDIMEKDDKYILLADVPGCTANDLELNMDKHRLTVFCRCGKEKGAVNFHYRIRERNHSGFSRTFSLPVDADSQAMVVTLKDGVLRIELKREKIPHWKSSGDSAVRLGKAESTPG
jgi:HSP20 family protein